MVQQCIHSIPHPDDQDLLEADIIAERLLYDRIYTQHVTLFHHSERQNDILVISKHFIVTRPYDLRKLLKTQ